jgi:predicted Rossmann-fold nucleotide-binding protein
MKPLRILILGSWHNEIAEHFSKETEELGRLIFERGHIPVVAPGAGIYGAVGAAYRKAGGKKSVGYYPSETARAKVGEVYAFEPDEKIMVEEDYPTRNLRQVQGSDAIIAIAGKTGTMTDFISGVADYELPCAYLRGSSKNMDALVELDGIKGKLNVFVGDTVELLLDFVEGK